jgi:two-component system sensor kinase FixL
MLSSGWDRTARKLMTDDRKKLRVDTEERLVRDSPAAPSRQSAPEIPPGLQVHEAELRMPDEERLKQEMANSDAIFEASPVAMLIVDESTNIVRVNAATLVMFGGARSDFEQHRPGNAMRCVHRSKDPRGCGYSSECPLCDVRNSIEALIAGGGAIHGAEVMLVLVRDGTPRKVWMEFGAEQVSLNGRRHLCVALSDITERKRAEAALREAQGILQAAMDHNPAGIAIADAPSGNLRYVNDAGLIILGGDRETVVDGIGIDRYVGSWNLLDLDGNPLAPDAVPLARAILHGETNSREFIIRRPSTDDRIVLARAAPVTDDQGNVTSAVVVFLDITESKQAEQAVAHSEAKYRALFDSLMDGFVRVGIDGAILEFNETYREMLGYSADELKLKTYQDLTPKSWHADEARIVSEQILGRGFSDVYEKEYRRKDGTVFPVEIRAFLLKEAGRPAAIWGIVRDVTETRALKAKLALASRLAAMGTLVSGVAHEINNPLAAEMADQGIALEVVREVRERLRGESPLDKVADGRALDGVVEALEDAMDSGERIARIVRDLSVFGRPDGKRQRARLMDIVDGAMRWLPATVARSAAIQVENGGAPDVLVSAGQIEQVLVNLLTNAAKATPEGLRDTVMLRVGPGLPGMARVEVIDHGIGIDPAIRDRIFDPFFTTRPAGPARGTGLGLAICQAIATAHEGTLTFETEVGKGSAFRLELPAAPVEA